MHKVLCIALAGAFGTLSRYVLAGLTQRALGSAFPWGTLGVNLLGCLLFGLVWSLAEQRMLLSAETRTAVLIGFLGAFTTFSTLAFETGQLLRDGEHLLAGANLVAQNVGGILFCFLGLRLAQAL